ncbi:Uma2 family endonuclease [Gloeobacter morelensis]|uniref:Uma2 family endonuclease n=1 Tax=Gloeobacter morelensis MG652769 TaxID=2781736 RepID=A0ABY3PIJ4_9CYAN|nr:Uma2 family endonuclease [Gloeobacter morelensis]UFP93490.1 Uma2 family endonuclease [Gloeobacter morelensis MG652769]
MISSEEMPFWPMAQRLPDSDELPVDNELQEQVAAFLRRVLCAVWSERQDWFFGVDMGIYFAPDAPPIMPDGFLSLGVERFREEDGRISYVLWQEHWVVPVLALEVVSQTYRGEYESKLQDYARLGLLYYVVYNPRRKRRRAPLEVYKLIAGNYVLQTGEPVWMPEIGLGIGRARGTCDGWQREWLYWFDAQNNCLMGSDEQLERLRAFLLSQGFDPDSLPS